MSDKIDKKGSLKLPSLVSDGMVLQRDEEIKIWGWAEAGQEVEIYFKGQEYVTEVNSLGEWSLVLPPQKAGGPFEMKISSSEKKIELKDILVGEVWLCSGQSNMELPMQRVKDRYAEEIKKAGNDQLRIFKLPILYNFKEENQDIFGANWKKVKRDNILDFSAVSYFFAKKLNEKYKVPVGVINASVGGSPVEAWMSRKALNDYPEYLKKADEFAEPQNINQAKKYNLKVNKEWADKIYNSDQGLQQDPDYYKPSYNDLDWSKVEIPVKFDQINFKHKNGVVWFRKEIKLTKEQSEKKARLWLGRIVDADTAYVNGKRVGGVTYKYPPRKYELKKGILKEGKNLIAIRIVVNDGQGEFVEDKPYKLILGDEEIDLRGEWKYKVGAVIKEDKKNEIFIQWQPTGLFNAMLAPLFNYKLKGVCWYQGESNTGREEEYKELFIKMIKLWRHRFEQKELPFIYAQLPNFEPPEENNREIWAAFRNAQREALKLNNSAMTVNLDLGEWNDLHPLNKKDVAHRFYLAARNIAYGEDVVYSGPQFDKAEAIEDRIIISFKMVDGGLKIKGDKLTGFEIAAADKIFKKAEAKIENDKVILYQKEIQNPEYFRYAWRDNPEKANLFNKINLPAGTFLEKI
ncbi:sialate O-acetylesterase [Halanaerobium saccharolyticum]|uniref:Sialate O-acetylesterase n=1 Tax=Halanaerobium saccharolyticum TaxID=43595 RepID=A0A4R7Z337_9FIRM|nr:sialate O-acetylesterase [Halanaerobium saccharolyticum]RAK07178.1 sialate O-acetylesterase [Halanaerobium saccharolyticum]TDW02091.1 sialate O-acetylesterase [Halanaerobium saccharolyticum]TDX58822.1 sialate O-acetylesterase [Halanaerobium saccharolyticum]